MLLRSIPPIGSFDAFRRAARSLLAASQPPDGVLWSDGGAEQGLFDPPPAEEAAPAPQMTVAASFAEAAKLAVCHSDPVRYALLYRLLWRLHAGTAAMEDHGDADVAALRRLAKAVSRDSHKMKAFVRFQEIESDTPRRRFAAWFEPSHNVTELTAPFFARRFADMDWVIATPAVTARCENGALSCAVTETRPPARQDGAEELWRTYYAAIFNPARLKVKAMRAEMPKKYWKNLPEAALIPDLIAQSESRSLAMQAALPTLPERRIPPLLPAATPADPADAMAALRSEAASCTRCDLCRMATQTVFGEGPPAAELMIVGEQPGDREDLEGRPFVGPAGQLLARALAEAGIDRARAFLTNAVKHFKYEPRGKFRLHKSPDRMEVEHCRWWLTRETAIVRPRLIVALGATAALSLTGNGAQVMRRRGTLEQPAGMPPVFVTVHPSSVLRAGGEAEQKVAFEALRADLAQARSVLEELKADQPVLQAL